MSFEGYYQNICANGHYTVRDVYEDSDRLCSECGAGFVRENLVDNTNCCNFFDGLPCQSGERQIIWNSGRASLGDVVIHTQYNQPKSSEDMIDTDDFEEVY